MMAGPRLLVACLHFVISAITAYINSSGGLTFVHGKYKLGLVVKKNHLDMLSAFTTIQNTVSFPWVEFASLIKLPQQGY